MNFQRLFFVMFDVKCNITYYQNKWGGLMVRVFASIPMGKGYQTS
jgi:hypothetical protein